MLAVLPAPAVTLDPVAPAAIALSGPAPEAPVVWMLPDLHRAGAEGGNAS